MSIPSGVKCLVVHCGNVAIAGKLCAKHYKQKQRHGEPSVEVSAKQIDGGKYSAHPLYQTWRSISRIALGTQICEEWKDFAQFVIDVGAKPEAARSLRRMDSSQPFSKNNATWYTPKGSAEAKEKARQVMRDFYAANPDYARWSSIKSMYGITKDDFEKLSETQGHVCAICKKPETRTTKGGVVLKLHIDHCHASKRVRGLLCHKCNTMLGHANDSAGILEAAIEYLRDKN